MSSNYLKKYGFFGYLRLVRDILYTRVFYNGARIIRRPNYIRGKKYINFGRNLTTGVGLRIDAFPCCEEYPILEFGNDIELNDYVHIGVLKSVKIGNNVLIASKVFITDHNHGNYSGIQTHDSPDTPPKLRNWHASPVLIEDNVWIGENVTILPGVTIGKGSIIGAMSLVNENIPAFTIAVGIPAKVIKKYNYYTATWEKI